MYYLGVDTSNGYVIVSVFDDKEELYFKQVESVRNSSEIVNVMVDEALQAVNIKPKDLCAVIVTRGPGSFTGVRIGISFAKVFAMILNIPLYSVSSMQLYSGLSSKSVILDARSKKCFLGKFNQGEIISEEMLLVSDLNDDTYVGKLSLINQEDNFLKIEDNFRLLKPHWKEESVFDATPTYLKSNI